MRKIHLRDKQKNILLSILAVIIACIFLFPLYWIIVNSFKIDSECTYTLAEEIHNYGI